MSCSEAPNDRGNHADLAWGQRWSFPPRESTPLLAHKKCRAVDLLTGPYSNVGSGQTLIAVNTSTLGFTALTGGQGRFWLFN